MGDKTDKEEKRKCFKCGASPVADGVKLFRFSKPGTRNLIRCEKWAKYIFPEREITIEIQKSLYTEHRVLCVKHFKDSDFTDASKTRLTRSAIPCDDHDIMQLSDVQAGPSSQRTPFADITNTEPNRVSISNIQAPKANEQNSAYLKCTKYIKRISKLQYQIRKMKAKEVLDTLITDTTVKKLQNKINPAFALLLQGQVRNCRRKMKGRRWSKEEKITALRIFKRSPTCYRLLRRLFALPSPSTLKNLLNKINFNVGCNKSIMKVLKHYVKRENPEDNQYLLMFDEMSLRKHLDYDIKNDVLEGFQDHGAHGRSEAIAGYALVFMVSGIRKKVKQPIAHFFSSGFSTADRLAVLLKEVLKECFDAGVNITATVCDMDGVNRRALSILGATSQHPYITFQGKEIITIYDTPHLLKCFRNLFIKYDIECDTNINSSGQKGRGVAKWSHIQQFFEIDQMNPNFVYAPMLRKDHLNPNSKQKMKVNLAAQVLSHSVAGGMFAKVSDGTLTAEAAVTAGVISNMDQLFDALNSDSSDLRRGRPYSTNMSENGPHLHLLEEMMNFFQNMKYVGSLRRPPSQDGWIWTINAIKRLWHTLNNNGVERLATRRLQQDPLENLFGCIRGNCGSNTNPTCGQFIAGLKTAVLSNLSHIGTSGNCETDTNIIINNFNKMLRPHRTTTSSVDMHNDTVAYEPISSDLLLFEIDEAINQNSAEIQACAYVCGFLIKKLNVKSCNDCKKDILADEIDSVHLFVENKEFNIQNKSLNYATKELIACVEACATLINDFLNQKPNIKNLQKNITENLRNIINFDFLQCAVHKEHNIVIILKSVFMISIKKYCVLKNRSFGAEAASSNLKRKMKIIMHT